VGYEQLIIIVWIIQALGSICLMLLRKGIANMKKDQRFMLTTMFVFITFSLMISSSALEVFAQDSGGDHSGSAAAANNPLANMTSFQLNNYYAPKLFGLPDRTSNTAWLRAVKPFGKWLVRASLPLSSVPTSTVPPSTGPTEGVSGVGDFNAFVAYLMTDSDAPQQYGVGPLVVAPTANDDALGVDGWQLGAAGVYFNLSSPEVQWGGLVTWQTDVSGSDNTNLAIAQPLLFMQMGKGAYLRSSGAMTFDIENNSYYIPVGFGIGKVIKNGRSVFNMFFEPQFTILQDGVGYPAYQIFAGINLQLLSKP